MENFNLTSNCSQTAIFYNALHVGADSLLALLRPLLMQGTNIPDDLLEAQLDNHTFTKELLSRAGHQCGDSICRNLNFPGNADIAGIGVRKHRTPVLAVS